MRYDIKNRKNYKNFKIFKENRLAPRAYFIPFGSREAAAAVKDPKAVRYSSDRVAVLNGEWDFKYYRKMKDLPDPFDTDAVEFDKIPVPSVWSRHGYEPPFYTNVTYPYLAVPPKTPGEKAEGYYSKPADGETYMVGDAQYNSIGVYRTFVDIEDTGKKYILSFLGVAGALEVYLNGAYVGYSEGSHDTAEFMPDGLWKEGENELVVAVRKWSNGSYLEDQDMFRENGIFRDVLLFENEPSFVYDFEFFTSKRNNLYDAIVNVMVAGADGVSVSVSLTDGGKVVAMRVQEAKEQTKLMLNALKVEEWSAEVPKLYDLNIVLMQGGKTIEYIKKKVGFKTVNIDKRVFTLNGKNIKLLGANHHDTDSETGYYMTPEKMERDIRLFKEYNMNAVRTSHYPPDPLFLELADIYGLYVVDEADIETHGTKTPGQISDRKKWREHYWDRVLSMFMRDRNSVSVTMWSLGNESGGIRCHDYCYAKLKPLTLMPIHYERAICTRRGAFDVASAMYTSVPDLIKAAEGRPSRYAFRPSARKALKEKPFFLCEYAHAMGLGPGNLDKYVEAFFRYDSLMGGCIWEFADHAVKHADDKPYEYTYGGDHGEYVHDGAFCVDGLFLPDRTPSTSAIAAKNLYRPVVARLIANGILELKNRLSFRNSSYLKARGKVMLAGDAVFEFELPMDIEPGAKHIYNLNFEVMHGDVRIFIDYFDGGRLVASEEVVANEELPRLKALSTGGGAAATDESGILTVRFEGGFVRFDKSTGAVAGYSSCGTEYLADLPAKSGSGRIYTNIYRAPTDNDMYLKRGWKRFGYDSLRSENVSLNYKELGNRVEVYSVNRLVTASGEARFNVKDTYTVYADGTVRSESTLSPLSGKMPMLPRVGKIVEMRPEFENIVYYGAGPYESYPDFLAQSRVGVYAARTDTLAGRYIRPQESGNRTDVRWAAVMNAAGAGVMFMADTAPINFGGKRFKDTALETFKHPEDVKTDENAVYYSVDGYMLGIGSNSCGPVTTDEYKLKCDRTYTYSFKMIPFTALKQARALFEEVMDK